MPKKRDRFDYEDEPEQAPELICWLCGRVMGDVIEWHHPVPKSRGGKQREPVHPICHKTIHDNFTNSQLERQFNTAQALLGDAAIGKFVDWIANKPPEFNAATKARK